MKTGEIIFGEFNKWVYNDENQAGDKLQVIDASDLPEIITEVVGKLTAHNAEALELLEALSLFVESISFDESGRVVINTQAHIYAFSNAKEVIKKATE